MYTRTLLFFLHVHQFLLTWGLSTFVLIHCIGKVLYGPLGDRWSFQRTAWQLENLVILSATENNFPKGLGISFEVIFINCKCCYSKVHLDCNDFFCLALWQRYPNEDSEFQERSQASAWVYRDRSSDFLADWCGFIPEWLVTCRWKFCVCVKCHYCYTSQVRSRSTLLLLQ